MSIKQKLYEIADRQGGYFTTRQAIEAGFHTSHFGRKLRSLEWAREQQGIYRLTHYPVPEYPDLVIWSLWSQNRDGDEQGVWSHDTALSLYSLSDAMPSKLHMTVPLAFRRRVPIPGVLHLHHAELLENDIQLRRGYRVTTPSRTIQDIVHDDTVEDHLISQAIRQAWERGMLPSKVLFHLQEIDQPVFKRIMRIIDETI